MHFSNLSHIIPGRNSKSIHHSSNSNCIIVVERKKKKRKKTSKFYVLVTGCISRAIRGQILPYLKRIPCGALARVAHRCLLNARAGERSANGSEGVGAGEGRRVRHAGECALYRANAARRKRRADSVEMPRLLYFMAPDRSDAHAKRVDKMASLTRHVSLSRARSRRASDPGRANRREWDETRRTRVPRDVDHDDDGVGNWTKEHEATASDARRNVASRHRYHRRRRRR